MRVLFTVFSAGFALGLIADVFAGTLNDYLITTPEGLLNNGADYLVITHENFTEALGSLADLRSGQGLLVRIAEVSLIYQTFQNEGKPRADAIKNFTQHTYDAWDPTPMYLLLVGDASEDGGERDLVPSKRFYQFYDYYCCETDSHCSDGWYGCLEGDDYIPEMRVGRLPVKSMKEAETFVKKIVDFETAPQNEQPVLMVNDWVPMVSPELVDSFIVPAGFDVIEAYGTDITLAQCRQTIIDGINGGSRMVYAIVHSGLEYTCWRGSFTDGSGVVFDDGDFTVLNNQGRYPIILAYG